MAIQSTLLAWRIPCTEKPGGLQSVGSQRVNWVTKVHVHRDLTFQVPTQYCSLWHWALLPSLITSITGCCFYFGSVSSFLLELFLHSSPFYYEGQVHNHLGNLSFLSHYPKNFKGQILSQESVSAPYMKLRVCVSHSVVSDSLRPHGL